MKLFQWFVLAFLLSFNTLTNSIYADDNNNTEDTGEHEEGEDEESKHEEDQGSDGDSPVEEEVEEGNGE